MKKILFILIILIVTGVVASADSRVNLLENEPFIVPNGDTFNFNNNWAGFTDTTTELSYTNNMVRELIYDTDQGVYNARTYFVKTKEAGGNNSKDVFITTRPSILNHFNATIVPGQKYEVGFSLKGNNILFDPNLNKYGVCAYIEWFGESDNYLGKSIKAANVDATLVNGSGESVYTDWTKYKSTFIAPQDAVYFTFHIYFDGGVYTSTYSDKVFFATPFMYVADTDPMTFVLTPNDRNYSVFNNTFLKNIADYVPGQDLTFTIFTYINWDVNTIPSEFSSYRSDFPDSCVSARVFSPRTPNTNEDCIGYCFGTQNGKGRSIYYIPINYGNLENGKYIAEVTLHKKNDPSVVISKKQVAFYITDQGYKGSAYGPVGTNELGNLDPETKYWLRNAKGVSTFLLGLVDKGVNYGYIYEDGQGPYGINEPTGTVRGKDDIGGNRDLNLSPPFYQIMAQDYLNPITKGANDTQYFSYTDFAPLGINAVFPEFLARVPSFYERGMLNAINELYTKAGISVFFPLQEFSRNEYNRDLQLRMSLQYPAFKSDMFGAGNAYTQMAKSLKGSANNILGYVLDDNLSIGDNEETIDKDLQMDAIDTERATAVFVDFNNINFVELFRPPYTDVQKCADVMFVKMQPKNQYWTEAELNDLKDRDNFLSRTLVYEKALIPVISIEKKSVGGGQVPLSVRDLIEIYRTYHVRDSRIAGLFFDDVAAMTVANPSANIGPKLHYDIFRLFLYEKDRQDYLNTPIADVDPSNYNPIQYVSIGALSCADYFNEVNVAISDVNGDGIEDYTYYFYKSFDSQTELKAKASVGVTDYYTVDWSVSMNNFQTEYTNANCFVDNNETTIFGGAQSCLPGIATFTMTFLSNGTPLP